MIAYLLVTVCLKSYAGERYEFYNGVRALGMGGAAVAVVNDETALLYNPAGLGKLRDYFITIIDPEIAIGEKTEQIAGLDFLQMGNPQTALTKALVNPDLHNHVRTQVFPSLVVPNFGIGLFAKYETNAEYDTTTNKFKYDYTNDYAGVFGFNFRIYGGIIKWGFTGRIVNRVEVHRDDIDPASTSLSLSSLGSEGLGIGGDSGLMITAPVAYLPTLAAVYRDIGRTTYNFRDGMFLNTTTKPVSTAESVDVALAINPIHGKRWRSTWTVEYRDALTASKETDHSRRTHAGVEFNFADAVFLRAGMNQRYWTTGFELSVMNYQLQAAYYGEEIGTAAAPRGDRRYVVKFAFRF